MRRLLIVLGVFAICFVTLEAFTARRISATWDEPAHLTAGYAALAGGDYRIDPSHPPFLRMWAALPLLFRSDVAFDPASLETVSPVDWVSKGHAYVLARDFLYSRNDADSLLFPARMMVVALGLLLGVLLFSWVNEWLGFKAGVIALALFLLSPNLAAHASLVTTDLGVTCFAFGATYFLWRSCRRFTLPNAAATAGFFALAMISKFSALLLVPAAFVLLAIAVHRRMLTFRQAGSLAAGTAALAFAAIWAVYGFRYFAGPTDWLLQLESVEVFRARAPVSARLAHWVDAHRLLPNAYTQGLLLMQVASDANPAYLAGQISVDGWWYYFPLAFLIKTPLALIALVLGGLWVGARRAAPAAAAAWAFLLLPVAAYLGIAMASGLNIGIRHILPVFPFVLIVAAAGASALASSQKRLAHAAVTLLLVLGAGEYVRAYPHPLTFFNQLVGGPDNGFRYLADSNLGWGQQLKPLKEWMTEQNVGHVNLVYFGQAEPLYYGIDYTALPGSSIGQDHYSRPRLPGYVALSGTSLTGVYMHPVWRLLYRPFVDMPPAAILGNSMRVYWVDEWPTAALDVNNSQEVAAAGELADLLQHALGWPEAAVPYYEAFLRFNPGDAERINGLAIALAGLGRTGQAVEWFRRGIALQPDNSGYRKNLVIALFRSGDARAAVAEALEAARLNPDDPDLQALLRDAARSGALPPQKDRTQARSGR